jgi:hypothetical protein
MFTSIVNFTILNAVFSVAYYRSKYSLFTFKYKEKDKEYSNESF